MIFPNILFFHMVENYWTGPLSKKFQAPAKQYEQNLNLANKEINTYRQEIMSNRNLEAQTYVQQILNM